MKDFLAENHGIQPGTGFTTKPGVAVTTAYPRKNRIKHIEPQRGRASKVLLGVS